MVGTISDDILRELLRLDLNGEMTGSESGNEMTSLIEKSLRKNDGELLPLSNTIAGVYDSWIQVKTVTLRYLETFPYNQQMSLKSVLQEVVKSPVLKKEIYKNRSTWTTKIKDWVITTNTQLDEKASICVDKVMTAFFKSRGRSGFHKCTVVKQLHTSKGDLAVPWQVEWEDGEKVDLKKYRWQFKEGDPPSSESSNMASEESTAACAGTTTVSPAPEGSVVSEVSSMGEAAQSRSMTVGSEGSSIASDDWRTQNHNESVSVSQQSETVSVVEGSASFVLVRTSAFKTARSMIVGKTTGDVDKLTNFCWDVETVCEDVVNETLKSLQTQFGDDQGEVISDLKCELWDTVERWVCEGFKVFFVKIVRKLPEMQTEAMGRQRDPQDWKSLCTTVKESLGKQMTPPTSGTVLRRYSVLMEDVVRKHCQMYFILRDGIQGCSQDLHSIVEDQAASCMRPRRTMSGAHHSRFHEDQSLMNRVLGTPAEYLLYSSRLELRAMSCCNHNRLHEYLINKHESSQEEEEDLEPWFCSSCNTTHESSYGVCPENFTITSPLYQRQANRRISCPLAVGTQIVREFYDTVEGQKIIRASGLHKYDVDHVIPASFGGADNVMNYFVMHPDANKWFGSDASKQADKMKLVGGVAKLCAVALKTLYTTFWNTSGMNRNPRSDVAKFRVLESKVDLRLDSSLTFSPYAFVLFPSEPCLKYQLCHSNVEMVIGGLEYVQGSEVERLDQSKYHTRGDSVFAKSQHVSDLLCMPNGIVEIEVREMKFSLWSAKDVMNVKRHVGVDERHFPTGRCFLFKVY